MYIFIYKCVWGGCVVCFIRSREYWQDIVYVKDTFMTGLTPN